MTRSGLVVPAASRRAPPVPIEFWQPCPATPSFEHGQPLPLASPKQKLVPTGSEHSGLRTCTASTPASTTLGGSASFTTKRRRIVEVNPRPRFAISAAVIVSVRQLVLPLVA